MNSPVVGAATLANAAAAERWYHQDGTMCLAGHFADSMLCAEGGGPVGLACDPEPQPRQARPSPLTPAEHVSAASAILGGLDSERAAGVPCTRLELAVTALAHGIAALAASGFSPEGGSGAPAPQEIMPCAAGTRLSPGGQGPASVREQILFWLAGASDPDGWPVRRLADQTGHEADVVQDELESLESAGLVRQAHRGKRTITWSLTAAASPASQTLRNRILAAMRPPMRDGSDVSTAASLAAMLDMPGPVITAELEQMRKDGLATTGRRRSETTAESTWFLTPAGKRG